MFIFLVLLLKRLCFPLLPHNKFFLEFLNLSIRFISPYFPYLPLIIAIMRTRRHNVNYRQKVILIMNYPAAPLKQDLRFYSDKPRCIKNSGARVTFIRPFLGDWRPAASSGRVGGSAYGGSMGITTGSGIKI